MSLKKSHYYWLIAGLFIGVSANAQSSPPNYDESKVGTYTLPDPLAFNDGKPVRNAREWKLRRQEIIELFQANVFGRSPKKRPAKFEVFDVDKSALGGKAVRKQVTIYFSPDKNGPKADLLIYIPVGASRPVPMFLTLNFWGNQSVINDPGIRLPTIWDPKTHERLRATEESRGHDKEFEVEKILARGYGFATICYQNIEPDYNGGYGDGIRPLFFRPGQGEPSREDWGAIGAWAYGLSRAMDYLEKDKSVDSKRVAIMGHSRLGKTALWAGAMDTRFAMVISSCSGEGGASLYRRNYGETIANLVGAFPYWFSGTFQEFADHADRLPVDAHELIALIAPRPVYITGGEDDRWADPKGEFLACVGAGPVFRLLGAQDLGTDEIPAIDRPIMHAVGFHVRTGKHAVTSFDWDQFLTFADMHLRR
jgi:(4-O-methyl)-D-glucuronate---lignin esterase